MLANSFCAVSDRRSSAPHSRISLPNISIPTSAADVEATRPATSVDVSKRQQLYYTPLYLRMILRQAGLLIDRFEFFFCQSPSFREQAKTKFAVLDEDVLIYEFFIHARRDDCGIK